MKVVIDIPNDFTGDYIVDKFKDFFSRVIADIDCNGMCGRYEKEIAEMFLKAFDDSEEKFFATASTTVIQGRMNLVADVIADRPMPTE